MKHFSEGDEGYEKVLESHKTMADIAAFVNDAMAYKSTIQLDTLQNSIKSGWISKDVR